MTPVRKRSLSLLKPEFLIGVLSGGLLGAALVLDLQLTRASLTAFALFMVSVFCLRILFASRRRKQGKQQPAYPLGGRVMAFIVLTAVASYAAILGYETAARNVAEAIYAEAGPLHPGEIRIVGIASRPADASALAEFAAAVIHGPAASAFRTRAVYRPVERNSILWAFAGVTTQTLVRETRAALVLSATQTHAGSGFQATFLPGGTGFAAWRVHELLGGQRAFTLGAVNRPDAPEAVLVRCVAEYLTGDREAALASARAGLSSERIDPALVPWLQAVTGLCLYDADQCDRALLFLREAAESQVGSPAVEFALTHCENQAPRTPSPVLPPPVLDDGTEPAPAVTDATPAVNVPEELIGGASETIAPATAETAPHSTDPMVE